MAKKLFKKGEKRPIRAGRKKGTPNKVTQDIIDRLRAIGCDPIDKAVSLLRGSKKMSDSDKVYNWLRLAEFVYPKRKSIEVKDVGPPKAEMVFKLAWADEVYETNSDATDEAPDSASESDT